MKVDPQRIEDLANAMKAGIHNMVPDRVSNERAYMQLHTEVCMAALVLVIGIMRDSGMTRNDEHLKEIASKMLGFLVDGGTTKFIRKS